MTKKQISKFVKKINYGVEIPISYFIRKSDSSCLAYVVHNYKNARIYINKHHMEKEDSNDFKVALLHEVGHIHTFPFTEDKIIDGEIYAQIWAITRATELKMYNLTKKAYSLIINWEINIATLTNNYWNTYLRRYILASRIFKKEERQNGNKLHKIHKKLAK